MNKLKTGLVAAAGTALGYLTLRRLRNRRRSSTDTNDAIEETESAADHAVAAADHAKRAGKIAVGAAREELKDVESNGTEVSQKSNGRLRRVRKGWMRR